MNTINKFIKNNWDKTIINNKKESTGIILPYPVSVPCESENYTCFFYWDTYFINLGLIYDNLEQAKNNIYNMKYLIEQLGYIPNGNQKTMFNRSQPPLYPSAVYDYYKFTNDKNIVLEHYNTIKTEYNYWMNNRITKIGLNQYNSFPSENDKLDFYNQIKDRNIISNSYETSNNQIMNLFAEAESGWDFTPRYDGKALEFIQIDLNSIMYKNESILLEFSKIIQRNDDTVFFEKACIKRKDLINKFLFDKEDNVYKDYNFIENKFSKIISTASIMPFWANLSDDKQLCLNVLQYLELEKGISVCQKSDTKTIFQWDYPNMWPPTVYFVFKALKNLKLDSDANRVLSKYKQTVEECYSKTSNLWEKYCAKTGDISQKNEYNSPKMLGWTAGVYRYLCENK